MIKPRAKKPTPWPNIALVIAGSSQQLHFMALLIKICGITSLEDAQAAVDAGADALGFMFYRPSKRFIDPTAARLIIRELPPHIAKVGVFVNAPEMEVRDVIAVTGIDTLQFHGEESPEFCERLRPAHIWKAFRIENRYSLRVVRRYPAADAWLLDSHVAGSQGGTGQAFDWDLAVAVKENGRPIILAGGLKPDNVTAAVERVKPHGVDVSSGVESEPGKKDHAKIAEFIRAARAVG